MTIQHIMEGNGNRRLVRVVTVETVEVNVAVVAASVVDVAEPVVACASGVVVSTVASLVLAAVVVTCIPLSGADLFGAGLDFVCPLAESRVRLEPFSPSPALVLILTASTLAATSFAVVLACSSGCACVVVRFGCLARPDAFTACLFAALWPTVVLTSPPPPEWPAAPLLHQALPQPSQSSCEVPQWEEGSANPQFEQTSSSCSGFAACPGEGMQQNPTE